jgi:SAM-dependent methyltransferase
MAHQADTGTPTPPTDGPDRCGVAARMTPFDEIYDQPDPRPYFRALAPWDYQTPHHAQRVFRRIVAALDQHPDTARPVTVLDLCCSYGINAALLNHDLTLRDLYDHYTSPQTEALTTAELIERDRAYYAVRRHPHPVRVIGLDVAPNAIAYARAVGLLDEGFAENLETDPPSPTLHRAAHPIRLITITGGAVFLSPRTFQPLLASTRHPVWVAAFVLRGHSYRALTDSLTTHGLITEHDATRTFPQRRFTDAREQQHAIDAVTAANTDPHGKETCGWFHTTLHLSRPAQDTSRLPLTTLLRDP